MRRALRLFALVALAWACADARGQAVLGKDAGRVELWPHVQVLADPGRALSVEQASAARERFGAHRGAYATLGMEKEVVWLRAPVTVAAGGEGMWILDIDYALLRRVDV